MVKKKSCNLGFGHMNSTFVCYHHYNKKNLVFPCADVTSRIQLIFSSKRNNNFQLFLGKPTACHITATKNIIHSTEQ